jgi:hypothetical protein
LTTRWDKETGQFTEDAAVDAFLADIEAVFKKHGMVLEPKRGFEVRKQLHHGDIDMLRASDIG